MRVNGARDTICKFDVQLWNDVFCSAREREERAGSVTPLHPTKKKKKRPTGINARFADITHGCALDHVPHGETLDRLVFGDASRAVGAAHESDVAAVFLVATAVSSFLGLSNGSG